MMQRRTSRRWIVEGTLGPVGVLAALLLLELRQQRAAALGNVGGHRLALCLQAESRNATLLQGSAAALLDRGKVAQLEPISPSVWRSARRNTTRSIGAVVIARGE